MNKKNLSCPAASRPPILSRTNFSASPSRPTIARKHFVSCQCANDPRNRILRQQFQHTVHQLLMTRNRQHRDFFERGCFPEKRNSLFSELTRRPASQATVHKFFISIHWRAHTHAHGRISLLRRPGRDVQMRKIEKHCRRTVMHKCARPGYCALFLALLCAR